LKSAVEHGLEEIVQAAAAFGLQGLEGADFGHAGGEFALEGQGWQRKANG
jgi:hypothetical protein